MIMKVYCKNDIKLCKHCNTIKHIMNFNNEDEVCDNCLGKSRFKHKTR